MPRQVSKWLTDDGKFFDTEEAAVDYEQYLCFMHTLRDELWCHAISVEEVAEWIYCNYVLAQRLTPITIPKGQT